MYNHTHDKPFFATIIGPLVIFMARPQRTRQKSYRQPIMVKKKRYPTKAQAETAAKNWEGLLI